MGQLSTVSALVEGERAEMLLLWYHRALPRSSASSSRQCTCAVTGVDVDESDESRQFSDSILSPNIDSALIS